MINTKETEVHSPEVPGAEDFNDSVSNSPSFYEEKHQKRMSSFKVGQTDPTGNKIIKIYSIGDEYVIYEIDDHPKHESMRVYIDSIIEHDMTKIYLFQKCKIHFDEFISTCYKYDCESIYKKRAATILSSVILDKADLSENPFKKIIDEIKSDYKNSMSGRNTYQCGAILLSLLVITFSIVAYLSRGTLFLKENHFVPIILYVSAFASMGGFISVSLKIKSLHTDRDLSRWVYFLYGSERILFSIIAGILVFFMFKGNMIFGFLNNNNSDISFSLYIVCALSGFSENLIPNALKNLESNSESKS
jgi:hypothetical protein